MNIEPLESRIAPASLTFTDVDGDKVLITTTGAGTLTLGVNVIVSPLPGAQTQIVTLDLTDLAFQGANVSIVATRDLVAGGDGLVNVGRIDAGGRDLGKVLVDGDLGQIFAGSGADPLRGITSLEVGSLGRFGTTTGAPGLAVNVDGKLGALKVKGDVRETLIFADSFGTISIGGSLLGGADPDSGSITSAGAIGSVKIKGDIRGSSGMESGVISAMKNIGPVTIGGSIIGGSDLFAGRLTSTQGSLGPVKIGGSVIGFGITGGVVSAKTVITSITVGGSVLGGSSNGSGEIICGGDIGSVNIRGDIAGNSSSTFVSNGLVRAGGKLGSVTVGGSLRGGAASDSGTITSGGPMGAVKIGGDILGKAASSGFIQGERIASLFVGGSIIAGSGDASGTIRADNDIGAITVKGSLIGNAGVSVLIIARGQATTGATTDVAIKSLTVDGRVERADILAGYTVDGINPPVGVNGDAQIGRVVVGDWFTSNLIAGVQDNTTAVRDDFFGEGDDRAISVGSGKIVSKIASIQIKGTAYGTLRVNQGTGIDHFGFVAQQIGSFKIGATSYSLTPDPGSDLAGLLVGATSDLRVREVAI